MKPVTTLEELDALDSDLMMRDYLHGFKSTPDYTQRDRAYWHGYLNGRVDCKAMPISVELVDASLIRDSGRRRATLGGDMAVVWEAC